MSIIQGLLGSLGGILPPSYSLSLSGSYNEGGSTTLRVDYQYAVGATIYWSIVADSATPGVDFTSDNGYSGSLSPTGSGSQTLANITNVNDNTTEGIEWYVINLGSTEGGSELYTNRININDTSIGRLTDFTIEWWQKMNSSQPSSYPRLFDVGYYSSESPGISFEGNPYSGAVIVWGGGTSDRVYATNFYPNEWTHWAIVRNNNAIALYRNGSNILGSNNLGVVTFNDTSSIFTIGTGSGTYWNGKITGFHWIKGTAKYTTDFNPIKMAPAAIADSKLLLNVVDDTHTFTDSALTWAPSITTNVSFDLDTPWYYNSVTNTLSGAGNALGIFNNTSLLGWSKIKPGWTITRVGGGWSSTVVSFNGATEIVAADNWLNDAADYTIAPPASIVYNSNTYGTSGGIIELQFDTSYTNLENVKSGWTVTNGSWSDTVSFDAYAYSGAYRVKVAGSVAPPTGDFTFTPPAQTGSLAFNSGAIGYAADKSWAFDVV